MLTAIRERATGWIAWIIVILITIPFALWGINSYFEGGSEIPVATVNGASISNYTYQQELSAQRQALNERLGGNFDPALLDTLGVKNRVIESLINNQLLSQFTIDHNFQLSDEQLRKQIQTHPSFLEDGNFNQTRYLEILEANRLSPQDFEQSQRAGGVLNQLQEGISDSSFYTEAERDRLLVLMNQTRTAQYTILNAEKFSEEFEITDSEVQDYYENNQDRFQTESRVKVNYVDLSVESLAQAVTLSEAEINSLYEETKGRYKTAESRKASHILVSVGQSASEEEKQARLELANEILARADAGEEFATLAQQYSDDPGSRENGGDLGVVARGQMVKPFEDAVFEMSEGDINGPIETQFGYHIIKLTALDSGSQQSLDEVRDKVEEEARNLQAQNQFAELAESFKNLVFEDPDNLTTTADEMDLKIQTSDWFTISEGEGVAADAVVRRAAFAEDVLNENLVSPAIEIGFDKLIAVQKLEYEPARPKSLEIVNHEIIESLKFDKSQAKVLQMGSDFLTELETGNSGITAWHSLIQNNELESTALPEKKAEYAAELQNLAGAVFALPVPDEGKVRFGGLALDSGDYALVLLENVNQGNLNEVEETQRTLVQQQLLARDGNGFFTNFSSLLRNNAEVTISQDQL
jgi:peptidyl-prolyl cis-trans isomerase D